MTLPTYQIQQVFNTVCGLLRGKKTSPERERRFTQIFLCENCTGRGYFKDKHNDYGTSCECCDGTGRIKLEFSVKQVDIKPSFKVIEENNNG
jgi:DnaJ-class molecular chaperone